MVEQLGLPQRQFLAGASAAMAMTPQVPSAEPGSWPDKPVRFVCGYAAGGLTDLFARLAAENLTSKYKNPFVVENKTGAGSIIAADMVAKSVPDGYTILFTNSTAMFQNQVILKMCRTTLPRTSSRSRCCQSARCHSVSISQCRAAILRAS